CAAGAWLALPGQAAQHVPAHKVAAIDTNGAGDTHVGAFIAGLAAGHTAVDACRIANIAAALSITKSGPATAPRLTEVLPLFEVLHRTAPSTDLAPHSEREI
ncbi:MAG: hypothetical protein HC783_02250, partial [Rhodobacteraceae bacterium]|nr:hypothetical protein [Paracoccaceae bacterium]